MFSMLRQSEIVKDSVKEAQALIKFLETKLPDYKDELNTIAIALTDQEWFIARLMDERKKNNFG